MLANLNPDLMAAIPPIPPPPALPPISPPLPRVFDRSLGGGSHRDRFQPPPRGVATQAQYSSSSAAVPATAHEAHGAPRRLAGPPVEGTARPVRRPCRRAALCLLRLGAARGMWHTQASFFSCTTALCPPPPAPPPPARIVSATAAVLARREEGVVEVRGRNGPEGLQKWASVPGGALWGPGGGGTSRALIADGGVLKTHCHSAYDFKRSVRHGGHFGPDDVGVAPHAPTPTPWPTPCRALLALGKAPAGAPRQRAVSDCPPPPALGAVPFPPDVWAMCCCPGPLCGVLLLETSAAPKAWNPVPAPNGTVPHGATGPQYRTVTACDDGCGSGFVPRAQVVQFITAVYLIDPVLGNDHLTFAYLRMENGDPDPASSGLLLAVNMTWPTYPTTVTHCYEFYDYFLLDSTLRDEERYDNPREYTFGYCSGGWVYTLLILGNITIILVLLQLVLGLMVFALRFREWGSPDFKVLQQP